MKHDSPPTAIYVTSRLLSDQYNWIKHETDRKLNPYAYSISTPQTVISKASLMCV